jgi:hypothetical protein
MDPARLAGIQQEVPPAAAAAAAAGDGTPTAASAVAAEGLLGSITEVQHALGVTTSALHCLTDLELHLLHHRQQQQQQQNSSSSSSSTTPVEAMQQWLQAAWHMAAMTDGLLPGLSGPGAFAAAVGAAKTAPLGPTAPNSLALRLLERITSLTGDMIKLVGAAVPDQGRFVFEVLGQLKQALTAVQHAVAGCDAGSRVSVKQLMQDHVLAELQHQSAAGRAVAAATMLSLVQVL